MSKRRLASILSTLALTAVIAAPTLAQAEGQRSSGVSAREAQAMRFVKARLGTQFGAGKYRTHIAPTMVQRPGNVLRPISGNRPLAVQARIDLTGKPSFFKRMVHKLKPKSRMRYYVSTDAAGKQHVVGQQSQTLLAKLRRRLPLAEKIHDIANSRGVRNGLVTGGLAVAASPVSNLLSLGGVAYAAIEMFKGVQRREDARRDAVLQTANWAKMSIQQGVKPSAVETFATYKEKLGAIKHGTHPGSMERFLDRLATHGL